MRISHRQLEAAIQNPSAWRRRQATEPQFFTLGYDQVVRLGVLRFHKTHDADLAKAHIDTLFHRHAAKLKNEMRIQHAKDRLSAYIAWAAANALDVVEANVNISLPTASGIEIGGRVTRVDLIRGGYRGVLLGSFGPSWSHELRFPLLQEALAHHYAIPVEDTSVGVQGLDGTGLQWCQFDQADREEASARLATLARDLGI